VTPNCLGSLNCHVSFCTTTSLHNDKSAQRQVCTTTSLHNDKSAQRQVCTTTSLATSDFCMFRQLDLPLFLLLAIPLIIRRNRRSTQTDRQSERSRPFDMGRQVKVQTECPTDQFQNVVANRHRCTHLSRFDPPEHPPNNAKGKPTTHQRSQLLIPRKPMNHPFHSLPPKACSNNHRPSQRIR